MTTLSGERREPPLFASWRRRVTWGMKGGLAAGAGLCGLVLITTGFGAAWPYEERGLGFATALLLYAAGGVLGGGAVGTVLPLIRHPLGAAVVGVTALVPFAAGFAIAVGGANWTGQHTFVTVILPLIVGAPSALILSQIFRSEIKDAERRWRRMSKKHPGDKPE